MKPSRTRVVATFSNGTQSPSLVDRPALESPMSKRRAFQLIERLLPHNTACSSAEGDSEACLVSCHLSGGDGAVSLVIHAISGGALHVWASGVRESSPNSCRELVDIRQETLGPCGKL
jgi:hypothetical protein